MITSLVKKVFGSRNDRLLKKLNKVVQNVNDLGPACAKLKDNEFPLKTKAFRERLQQGETLDSLLPESFALVREASKRTLGMPHFDVQIIGGIILHHGKISEMRTGEGKTLVATLPAYLNALTGMGVHVITVNDYLAKRDFEWMNHIYQFLGLETGVIFSGIDPAERKAAYLADITYGTNNEFGFDYLRDNLAFSQEARVQRALNYAIIDEVDSILIDEARTPLIISGTVSDKTDVYIALNKIIPKLKKQLNADDETGHFSIDEKLKQAYLTEAGNVYVENLLKTAKIIPADQNLYAPNNVDVLHHLNAAIRAHTLFHKDVEYIIANNEVVIVDEFTGRTMSGRRWSDGLHQALEAKEGIPIQDENQTLATITYQNYFRLYNKLSGMTGTADTEAFEFHEIYQLEVVVIPTHMPMIRRDYSDVVYLQSKDKFDAIIADIKQCVAKMQPVLVGTASIDVSEHISKLLKKEQIKHQILNAKQHEKEAEIIGQAGAPGSVTIATNMAGRGTDIVLGGNFNVALEKIDQNNTTEIQNIKSTWEEKRLAVIASGGLSIIGTERHESRRIDNQLRGRSGRQGDPGSSRFYLSLEDNLMRIFASDRVSALMQRFGMGSGEAIESSLVSRAIENAQKKVEAHNFDIRKHLLEYDNVANEQRKVIYEQRNYLLGSDNITENIVAMRGDVVDSIFYEHIPLGSVNELWEIDALTETIKNNFSISLNIADWLQEDAEMPAENIKKMILDHITQNMQAKEKILGDDLMRKIEKQIMLDILDRRWKEHLAEMDHLRQGINLRSYAAKNPVQEYKREAFNIFATMLDSIKHDVISFLSMVNVSHEQDTPTPKRQKHSGYQEIQKDHQAFADHAESNPTPNNEKQPFIRETKKIGRNALCPCGSGEKYKKCHGKLK